MFLSKNARVIGPGLLCLILIVGLTLPAYGQQTAVQWHQSNGPPGGYVSRIKSDPFTGKLWAAIDGISYYTTDGGDTWTPSSPAVSLRGMTFSPDGRIYTLRYQSADSGESWTKINLPDSVWNLVGFAAGQSSNDIVVGDRSNGIYSSSDNGASWLLRYAIEVRDIKNLGGENILARVIENGSYKLRYSSDFGITWQQMATPGGGEPVGIIRSHDQGEPVYLTTTTESSNWASGGQVYKSLDQGASWQTVDSQTCNIWDPFGFDVDGNILGEGGGGQQGVVRQRLDDLTCQVIYDNQRRGNRASTLRAAGVDANGRIFVYTGYGEFFRSTDTGASWTLVHPKNVIGTWVRAIFADGRTGKLWAGTDDKGLFSSTDNGIEWTYRGFAAQQISSITRGEGQLEMWTSSFQYGLYHSTDGGESWTVVDAGSSGYTMNVTYDPVIDAVIVFASSGIHYSLDGGLTWLAMSSTFGEIEQNRMVGLGLAPDGSIFVAVAEDQGPETRSGIFRADGLNQDWQRIDSGFPLDAYNEALFVFDENDRIWIANGKEIQYSVDSGATWIHSKSVSSGWVNTFKQTPDGSIWAGHGVGLIRTSDGGASWFNEHEGLDHPGVWEMEWDEANGIVWLGTIRGGLYGGSLNGDPIAITTESLPLLGAKLLNLNHYPNPTSGRATITFELQTQGEFRITLFDLLGRRVQQILDRPLRAGQHEITIDLSSLPAGYYYYTLSAPFGEFGKSLLRVR